MKKILLFIGTRPEAIKLTPVIHALRRHPGKCQVRVCSTGQHDELLRQVFGFFHIAPDVDLHAFKPGQSLEYLTAALLQMADEVLGRERPDWVIVQGDTATALAGAFAAFRAGIPVAHVEAGLRSGFMYDPYPEELIRVLIAHVAEQHFAPTPAARDNLLAEGISAERILLCGNTAIDALLMGLEQLKLNPSPNLEALAAKVNIPGTKLLTLTLHRRENLPHMEAICRAMLALLDQNAFSLAFPMHPNPEVRQPALRILGAHPRVKLLPPLPYSEFLFLLQQSLLILTDSGGIQEEAPTLGKPVVVLRTRTERPELMEGYGGVPCDPVSGNLREAVAKALAIDMSKVTTNPFGDGQAAGRIAGFFAALAD